MQGRWLAVQQNGGIGSEVLKAVCGNLGFLVCPIRRKEQEFRTGYGVKAMDSAACPLYYVLFSMYKI